MSFLPNLLFGGLLGVIDPAWASLNEQGAAAYAGIPGVGGASSSSSASGTSEQPETAIGYTPNAPDTGIAGFNWQTYAPEWAAIGGVLLFLLLLGSFDATRELAIAIAIIIALVLIMGKVSA